MSERSVKDFLQFIRFSHTVFALPFALGALFVAANGLPSWQLFGLVLLCMIFARTAAMTFNRIADWEIDKRNPRTERRHKLMSKPGAIVACLASSALFIATTAFINPLCFWLSPVALGIVFFYSFTKRFTDFAQFFLGLALAVAPVGAWLAVTGSFAIAPVILAGAVLLWVAGFDMIYATQDYEVDRREGLHSMVVRLGVQPALACAVILHILSFAALVGFGIAAHLGAIYYGGLVAILVALVFEHRLAGRGSIDAINAAFFQTNAAVGAIFVLATLADRLLKL
jgi:4-hydroxybenzoate polyprenyltransferase